MLNHSFIYSFIRWDIYISIYCMIHYFSSYLNLSLPITISSIAIIYTIILGIILPNAIIYYISHKYKFQSNRTRNNDQSVVWMIDRKWLYIKIQYTISTHSSCFYSFLLPLLMMIIPSVLYIGLPYALITMNMSVYIIIIPSRIVLLIHICDPITDYCHRINHSTLSICSLFDIIPSKDDHSSSNINKELYQYQSINEEERI